MSAPTWTIEQWVEHGRAWRSLGWAPASISWAAILIGKRGDTHCAYSTSGLLRSDGTVYSDYFVEWVPDMRDPGTRGHALAQVRDAWDEPFLFTSVVDDGEDFDDDALQWTVTGPEQGPGIDFYPSEAEALLAAREAAP